MMTQKIVIGSTAGPHIVIQGVVLEDGLIRTDVTFHRKGINSWHSESITQQEAELLIANYPAAKQRIEESLRPLEVKEP